MSYYKILLNCIDEALSKKGRSLAPVRLLTEISKLKDPFFQAYTDIENFLYNSIKEDFSFIETAQQKDQSLNVEESIKLTALIRWLNENIKNVKCTGYEDINIVSCMFTIEFISARKYEKEVWTSLNFTKKNQEFFFKKILYLIENSPPESFFRTIFGKRYITDDVIRQYHVADVQRNFLIIHRLERNIEYLISPRILFRQSIFCLCFLNFKYLIDISYNIQKTSVAFSIAQILDLESQLLLSSQSRSLWIKFWCLYNFIEKQFKKENWFEQDENQLTHALYQLSFDIKNWENFLSIFNRYPSSYPALQKHLGKALEKISDLARGKYIESIHLSRYDRDCDRHSVGVCIDSFCQYADLKRIKEFLTYCYRRWNYFIVEEINKNEYHDSPFVTNLDYALVEYLVRFENESSLNIQAEAIVSDIRNINNHWYTDHCKFISTYNLMLTRLQPYVRALSIVKKTCNKFLPEGYALPIYIKESNYYQIILKQKIF